ncbi:MAG: DUF1553 domain-containing protein [Bryobacterales bacterium]|nr:DUF1553 domain-containing protein [Bryobacterales bacterium]
MRFAAFVLLPALACAQVSVSIYENLPKGQEFELMGLAPVDRYSEPTFAFPEIPVKYSPNALMQDRSSPFVLKAEYARRMGGRQQIRLRARGAAVLYLDGKELLRTKAQKANTSGDDPVPEPPVRDASGRRPAHYPHQDVVAVVALSEGEHRFELVAVIGGKGLMPSPGELTVGIGKPGAVERILGADDAPMLTDAEWESYTALARERMRLHNKVRRGQITAAAQEPWDRRHERIREWLRTQPAVAEPEASKLAAHNRIDRYLNARMEAAGAKQTALLDDVEFLRRISLDATGLIPTPEQMRAYLYDRPEKRRANLIEKLLASESWADGWVPYWQDVLAENPGILKPDLNNTGPFRWWLHQSLADGISFDRFVTELIEMEGSMTQGAPAAFSQSTLNDAPMAAKGDIVGRAFLGANLGCARCHDAPFHPVKQKDLFSLAAMLAGKPVTLPATSSVPFVEGARRPAVKVTLKPGEEIAPEWPFAQLVAHASEGAAFPGTGKVESRRQLAELIVAPENERFAQVVVNRIWARYMGAGIVDPVDDWARTKPSHPELLRYLGREFVWSGYDVKHIARMIFQSHAYQRKPAAVEEGGASKRLFTGPVRRKMSAEQLVDSLHLAAGKALACEELNLNPAGDRPATQFLNMGKPERAWQMTALSNERDRPALALPIAQSLVDMLTTFGWRQSRQAPASARDDAPSPMQTLILANGNLGTRVVRLSDESAFTKMALEKQPLDDLIRDTYFRVFSRKPAEDELRYFHGYLEPYYLKRQVAGAVATNASLKTDNRVSWSNHLSAEATLIRMEEERNLRMGEAPTKRLTAEFRERYEDMLWAMFNSPEFVLLP